MNIFLAGFTDKQHATIRAMFPETHLFDTQKADMIAENPDALVGITRGAFDEVFKPEVIDKCTNLRWVHAPGAGIDTYLYPNLADAPFTLTNGKIIQGPEVAEQGVALLLALTRRIAHAVRGIPRADIPRPIELRGKHALVIGLGGIGLNLAEKLAAFGMKISAVTETNMPLLSFISKCYMADQLHEALADADAVFMVAPLTPASRNMLDDDALAAMKDGAYLVNVSRGGTIDTDAVYRALTSGKLAGAGLDVTNPEPLPADHPLRALENVIVTPHLAGISDNLEERNFELISTNIRRFTKGLPLINVVDKTLGF